MKAAVISLRMPSALLAEIDEQAAREQRSRSQVVVRRLNGAAKDDDDRGAGSGTAREVERGRDDAPVPILPAAKSGKRRLHTLQPVRDQLAPGNGLEPAAAVWPCQKHHGKSYANGDQRGCIECERK